jgi:glucose-6-phosphate 1-epimerase
VVWNPGPEIAGRMADLDDEAYRRFVCVETTNAGEDRVTLKPGGECCIGAGIELLSRCG